MLILLVKLLDCNHTGADHISGLHRDSRCSFFLRCHFAFCIDGRYLFIGAAVGNLGYCSGRRQLWLDCEGFALFQCLAFRHFVHSGRSHLLYRHLHGNLLLSGLYRNLGSSGFLCGDDALLADRYDLLIRRAVACLVCCRDRADHRS